MQDQSLDIYEPDTCSLAQILKIELACVNACVKVLFSWQDLSMSCFMPHPILLLLNEIRWAEAVWIQRLSKAFTHDQHCRNRTPDALISGPTSTTQLHVSLLTHLLILFQPRAAHNAPTSFINQFLKTLLLTTLEAFLVPGSAHIGFLLTEVHPSLTGWASGRTS